MSTIATIGIGAVLALSVACTKASDTGTRTSAARPKASEAADSAPADRAAAVRGSANAQPATPLNSHASIDVCGLLSGSEIADITGVPVERVEKKPNGCEWYANAAVQRQKNAESARSTFAKLNREEPKSADAAAQTMESLLKGVSGAADPNKALFAVTVQWENADQAEAVLRTTVDAVGGGLPGGRLEPIEGVGDRAFMGPMGSLFYARKGPVLVMFGLSLGTREQAIALAKKVISRI